MSTSPESFAYYVKRVRFRRRLLGYDRAEVDRHLDLVAGWFSLAGLDDVLQARLREPESEAEQRLAGAHEEAARISVEAQAEAAEVLSAAKREAEAIIGQARRRATLERRGRTQLGRPVGGRLEGH